jgi:hypothetical protein
MRVISHVADPGIALRNRVCARKDRDTFQAREWIVPAVRCAEHCGGVPCWDRESAALRRG